MRAVLRRDRLLFKWHLTEPTQILYLYSNSLSNPLQPNYLFLLCDIASQPPLSMYRVPCVPLNYCSGDSMSRAKPDFRRQDTRWGPTPPAPAGRRATAPRPREGPRAVRSLGGIRGTQCVTRPGGDTCRAGLRSIAGRTAAYRSSDCSANVFYSYRRPPPPAQGSFYVT